MNGFQFSNKFPDVVGKFLHTERLWGSLLIILPNHELCFCYSEKNMSQIKFFPLKIASICCFTDKKIQQDGIKLPQHNILRYLTIKMCHLWNFITID